MAPPAGHRGGRPKPPPGPGAAPAAPGAPRRGRGQRHRGAAARARGEPRGATALPKTGRLGLDGLEILDEFFGMVFCWG